MAAGRRSIAAMLLLMVAVAVAAAYGSFHLFAKGGWPWGGALPWHQMEALLESQSIASISVDARLKPAEGHIEGTATLGVTHPGGDGDEVLLLLNPGLDVSAVRCEDNAVPWHRDGERLAVSLPPDTVECTLTIAYAGVLVAANSAPLLATPDCFIADRLQWWYPQDLKSFAAFTATVRLPEDMEVAWSGTPGETQRAEGERIVQWTETRPVLAVGLAAGRFDKLTRLQGGVRCNIFSREVGAAEAGAWLSALGDAYNYYATVLGPDGFPQLNLVVAEGIRDIAHIGGPTIVAPPEALADPDAAFASIAAQVARNWWGDTVSGRWFTSRPEAGEWLVSGMSEYFAWQALRQVKGRRAYLRFMEEQYIDAGSSSPMKLLNLDQRLEQATVATARPMDARGPYAAGALAQYIGPDAFARACRNFIAVHRHTTVSYAALLHEMTLASEKPLDELVRVWFDRAGTLDYGITSVAVDAGAAHVTIENLGDIPAYVPITIGALTEDGYQVQTVDSGAQAISVRFVIEGPLQRIVLDPEFALGDRYRANNIWPPTQWPRALDVSRNGRIALLAQTEWGGGSSRRLQIFSLVDKTASHTIAPGEGVVTGFQWDPDGQQLALWGGIPGLWERGTWTPDPTGAVFLGWHAGDPVYWLDGTIEWPKSRPEVSVPLPLPAPGFAAIQEETGAVAYVTDSRVLAVWDPDAARLIPLKDNVHPVGGLRWRGRDKALIYFDAGGKLFSVDTDTGATEVLLGRNYPIHHARLSPDGGRAAWVDPAGLLRAFTPGGGEAVYISLPGEVVDFAWEGEDALIAIVATVPRRLPMRFHADYTLWRIPASTWTGLQLPYDPAQFTANASDVPLVRAE